MNRSNTCSPRSLRLEVPRHTRTPWVCAYSGPTDHPPSELSGSGRPAGRETFLLPDWSEAHRELRPQEREA